MTPDLSNPDAVIVGNALGRLWRGDHALAERWLRDLDDESLRQACTVLRRLAVLVEMIRFEDLATRIAARPPAGVDGCSIGGRA
jgi:hypothetical protein